MVRNQLQLLANPGGTPGELGFKLSGNEKDGSGLCRIWLRKKEPWDRYLSPRFRSEAWDVRCFTRTDSAFALVEEFSPDSLSELSERFAFPVSPAGLENFALNGDPVHDKVVNWARTACGLAELPPVPKPVKAAPAPSPAPSPAAAPRAVSAAQPIAPRPPTPIAGAPAVPAVPRPASASQPVAIQPSASQPVVPRAPTPAAGQSVVPQFTRPASASQPVAMQPAQPMPRPASASQPVAAQPSGAHTVAMSPVSGSHTIAMTPEAAAPANSTGPQFAVPRPVSGTMPLASVPVPSPAAQPAPTSASGEKSE